MISIPRAIQRLAWVSVIASLAAACSSSESEFETAPSPDGRHVLIVTVSEPALPHARHTVAVYIERADDSVRRKLIETKLANDGVPFTSQNIGLRWTSATTALVCLRPTDLADRGIRVDAREPASAEILPGC